ncbi:glycosyltransferase family 2 protein [Ethanoligenens sp.]|uniref:glycosyltransferase family 2 protein n=1 Tax=Ethanoligenens sp. TaxID=2099655 RepID=UPI0039E906BF
MSVPVSIIVPVYNAEKSLSRCINSLLNQTCRSIELVLVDDGSTDKSPAICDAFAAKDARVRVLHTANAGPAAARNAGMDAASGVYLGFADADDWTEPDMFAALYSRARETDADLVVCDYWMDKPGQSAVCKTFPGGSRVFTKDDLRMHILPYFFGYAPQELSAFTALCPFADARSYVWCCLYRAAPLKERHLRFPDEKRYYTEDNLFNLLVTFHAERAAYLARPLYHYVEQASTFTGRFQPAYFSCRLHKYTFLDTFAAENGLEALAKERLPRKICAEIPTLLNYYAANAPTFSKKYHFIWKIIQDPTVTHALAEVSATEWPAGRLGTTLAFAKRKQAICILLACLAQKALRSLKK